MSNWWIRFGCFLTGYNYAIVRNSSEVSAKAVKKYTAAMVIVCILWSFVGFTFTNRYLSGNKLECIAGAAIAIVIIVQIERQIILSSSKGKGVYVFRFLLGFLMSLIGAVIIDQIILKQDIDLERIQFIEKRVDSILPSRTAELRNQIIAIDTTIQAKERELEEYVRDVKENPGTNLPIQQSHSVPIKKTTRDSAGNTITVDTFKTVWNTQDNHIPNPKQALIPALMSDINAMRNQKSIKSDTLLNIRPSITEELTKKVGFLDELKVMYKLITDSGIALGFWLLWLVALLLIELLVLFAKIGDTFNDYDQTVIHQMTLQKRKLNALNGLVKE